ncbi:MAG TPA: HAMP domain-containing sensor histidine kinase [Acidimicrobiales bacterium]|nr:HAMP domain-containing sensor histidine kinase [Acidimicrobiales bacterium]
MSDDEIHLLRRQLDRERRARHEAESIAERVTAELYATVQTLVETNEVLDSANRSIRDFVAVASHDLRQPLNGIIGLTSLLISDWDEDDDEHKLSFLSTIVKQGEHLNRIVEDLLTVSQIEAGAMESHIEEVCLRRLIDEIATEFVADSRPSDLSVSCPPDLRIKTDPHHLRRILVNYLTNAFKYGDPPVTVQVDVTDEWVKLAVCDQGEGVPPEFVPQLFDRFTRADRTARTRAGTGLGLSIVRGLAAVNGGEAWYEPHEPRGSCFGLTLPRHAAS